MGLYNDKDMKIVPDDIALFKEEALNATGDTADDYLKQRQLGNIKKAHTLGAAMALELLDCVFTAPPEGVDYELFSAELQVLFAYVVKRCVEMSKAINSIVAHTVIGTFYGKLEEHDEKICQTVEESPSFSLYIYLSRIDAETAESIATVFYDRCDSVEATIDIAIKAWEMYKARCMKLIEAADFK